MPHFRTSLILACLVFFVIAALTYSAPQLIHNEGVYLIKGKQLVDPAYLSEDWSFGHDSVRTHGMLFSVLTSPLWLASLDGIDIALIIRALQTIVFLACAIALFRSLGLSPVPGVIGLAAWIIVGQLAIAGEWVLGGAEQKPFAYATILLALAAAVRSQWYRMAGCLGLATWLHILVGGWAAIFAYGTLLIYRSALPFRTLVASAALALAIVMPVLTMTYIEMGSTAGMDLDPISPFISVAQLMVEFRVPHHINPDSFLSFRDVAQFCLLGLMLVTSIWILHISRHAKVIIIGFSGLATSVALVGLLAKTIDLYWFLGLYPFRVADAAIPLLAFALVPYALIQASKQFNRTRVPELCASVILALSSFMFLYSERDVLPKQLQITTSAWSNASEPSAHSRLFEWIQRNTRVDSQFLVPPWWGDFRIIAQRPMFLSIKSIPNNDLVWEWFERLILTNNSEPFPLASLAGYESLRSNYAALSSEALTEIRNNYGIEYFGSETERSDIAGQLVYGVDGLFLYRLN